VNVTKSSGSSRLPGAASRAWFRSWPARPRGGVVPFARHRIPLAKVP
jgi:hypothetical protein